MKEKEFEVTMPIKWTITAKTEEEAKETFVRLVRKMVGKDFRKQMVTKVKKSN